MNLDVIEIQNLMRELVLEFVKKHNQSIVNKNDYNIGIAYAYCTILSNLYNQAKIWHIPLNYLSLHTFDPEEVSYSLKEIDFESNLSIPNVKLELQKTLSDWLSYNIIDIKELYEDFLPESKDDEFYSAMITGFEEIFVLFEKYNITIIDRALPDKLV